MLTRREIIRLGVAALAASQFSRSARAMVAPPPQKILVLGGTDFLGPPIVKRAFERSHTVTLFNRGKTRPDLFPNLEAIRGDREAGGKGDLSGLQGERKWDAIIDVWPSDPAIVLPMAKLLANRAGYYFFVSSIAVYSDYSKIGMDETGATRVERPGYGGG